MEDTSCDRKEALDELVGDISKYWVTEGPFGRIRAKNKDTVCKITVIYLYIIYLYRDKYHSRN